MPRDSLDGGNFMPLQWHAQVQCGILPKPQVIQITTSLPSRRSSSVSDVGLDLEERWISGFR